MKTLRRPFKIQTLGMILVPFLLMPVSQSIAGISTSFNQAKVKMYKVVYNNSGKTFYTGCDWSRKKVDLGSCNLQNSFPKKEMKRANRTEAEHVIPASWFYKKNGKFRQCYHEARALKQSPRSYCQDHDIDYRNAHNDLFNLRVSVGQINANRSNHPFAETPSGEGKETFNGNGLSITLTSRVAIPDASIRGDIARIAAYMKETYGVSYSARQDKLFEKWNKQDPVDAEEFRLLKKISQIQR